MKNKLFKSFALALGALTLTISCTDVVNELPENKAFTETTDYSISDNMILPLIGAYANFSNMGWELNPLLAVRGDDVNKGGLGDQKDLKDIDNFSNYNKDFWMLNSAWQGLYSDIYKMQVAIDEVYNYMEAGASASKAEQYVAEIKTLKAFFLLQLGRAWGDILIPTTSSPSDLLVAELTPRDEVFAYLQTLLDEAIPNLPEGRPNQRTDIKGGVTKATALALKAKVSLELNDYQSVADATSQIIANGGFSLVEDFSEAFKLEGKLSNEMLLEMQHSDYNQGSGDRSYHLFAFYGPQKWTPAVSGAGGGWGFWEPSKEYIKFMLDRGEEERLVASVLFTPRGMSELEADGYSLPSYVSNTTPYGDTFQDYPRAMYASGKHYMPSSYLIPGRTSYGSNKNFPVLRYAEVLLMHAEALTNGANGSGMTADQAVNAVRSRAGMAPLSGVTSSDVMEEKLAELAMEWGDRFYDSVRTGNTSHLNQNGANYDDSKRYFPYPQAQVDLLPALQN